jgi:hypothetical protein
VSVNASEKKWFSAASIGENKDLRNSGKFEDRTIFSLIEFLSLSIYYLNIWKIPFEFCYASPNLRWGFWLKKTFISNVVHPNTSKRSSHGFFRE